MNLTFSESEIRVILPSIKEFEVDLFLVFHLYLLYCYSFLLLWRSPCLKVREFELKFALSR